MQLFANNAASTLAGALGEGTTTVTVYSGHGARYPTITSGGDYFYCTLEDAAGNIEIVKVTAHTAASDSMAVERAQQGTSARSWAIGDAFELRQTAQEATRWEFEVDDLRNTSANKNGESYVGSHNFSGASGVALPASTQIGAVAPGEILALLGIIGNIQDQIDAAQPLSAILNAIVALAASGMIVRTGAGAVEARSIVAGAGCVVTNGDGVSGNPTISVSPGTGTGDMLGPAGATDGHVALFDGASGKALKSGGKGLPGGAVVGTTDAQTLTNKTMGSGCAWGGAAVPIANGGTGQTSAANALDALGGLPKNGSAAMTGTLDSVAAAGAIAVASQGTPGVNVRGATINDAAYMTFEREGASPYGVRFGLDTNNRLSVGGWNLGANSFRVPAFKNYVVNTNTTALAGGRYILTAGMVLTMPAAPVDGDQVAFVDRSGGGGLCSLARNGALMRGQADDVLLDADAASAVLTYVASINSWE